jgi:hypothetical protein
MPPRLDERGRILAAEINRDDVVPTPDPLPELASMLCLSKADLLDVLHRINAIDKPLDLRADTQRYLSRFPRLAADPERFAAEMDRLLDATNERRALLGLARRTQERYTTIQAVDGNPAQELIRISEGDDHVCDECAALEGAIGTYEEHAAIGLPGAQSCLGGDYCRCQLVPIRDK